MKTFPAENIDQYIKSFPSDVQKILRQVRATVRKAAPGAKETIKYAMPAYVLNGNLVYFAAFKSHIGFYPAPTNDESFAKALSRYKTGRGSIQFPFDKPMPLGLITKIVKWRIRKNKEAVQTKRNSKKQAVGKVIGNDQG